MLLSWISILMLVREILWHKSHDCHMFMDNLLPITFISLPKPLWSPIIELNQFFKDLSLQHHGKVSFAKWKELAHSYCANLNRFSHLNYLIPQNTYLFICHMRQELTVLYILGGRISLKVLDFIYLSILFLRHMNIIYHY